MGQVVIQGPIIWKGRKITAKNPIRKLVIHELNSPRDHRLEGYVKGIGTFSVPQHGDLVKFDVKIRIEKDTCIFKKVSRLKKILI